ncbi:MAG: hypothetical protein QM811_22930 [Pirellulales bacterium]
MPEQFDPYLKWLGIRDPQRPPNHYRLLGLEPFEQDAGVIALAADRQMAHVRNFQAGEHAEHAERILNELAAARLCLLKPERRAQYEQRLRSATADQTRKPTPTGANTSTVAVASRPQVVAKSQPLSLAAKTVPAIAAPRKKSPLGLWLCAGGRDGRVRDFGRGARRGIPARRIHPSSRLPLIPNPLHGSRPANHKKPRRKRRLLRPSNCRLRWSKRRTPSP